MDAGLIPNGGEGEDVEVAIIIISEKIAGRPKEKKITK